MDAITAEELPLWLERNVAHGCVFGRTADTEQVPADGLTRAYGPAAHRGRR